MNDKLFKRGRNGHKSNRILSKTSKTAAAPCVINRTAAIAFGADSPAFPERRIVGAIDHLSKTFLKTFKRVIALANHEKSLKNILLHVRTGVLFIFEDVEHRAVL